MDRRSFLKRAGLSGVAMTGALSCEKGKTSTQKPNVVLVTMDTASKKHFSCYGYGKNTTPMMDKLARKSLFFEDFYASGNQTYPNHASIFTGLYPHHHKSISQTHILRDDVDTIGGILGKHGYHTAAVTSQRFLNQNTMGNGFQQVDIPDTADYVGVQPGQRRAEVSLEHAHLIIDQAVSKDVPLYLWIHLWDPHGSYSPPEDFKKKFLSERDLASIAQFGEGGPRGDNLRLYLNPSLKMDDNVAQAVVALYDAEIAYMDQQIGLFLNQVEAKHWGFHDNTIFILTADHGESLFEQDQYWYAHDTLHAPVTDIPLIIKHPQYAGQKIPGLAQNIDLLPTILDWTRIPCPPVDGKSLVPLIGGEAIRDKIFLTKSCHRTFAVTDGKTKIKKHVYPRRPGNADPVPAIWEREIKTLPPIEFCSEDYAHLRFSDSNGAIEYSWNYPQNRDKIKKYAREVLSEFSGSERGYRHITTYKDKVTFRKNIASVRDWSERSFNTSAFRIVGLDGEGKVIATSPVVLASLDAPLGDTEIYDMVLDPDEKNNLATSEHPDTSALENALMAFAELSEGIIDVTEETADEQTMEEMRALGYL
jgi:arylsulfatase A-like enzyme